MSCFMIYICQNIPQVIIQLIYLGKTSEFTGTIILAFLSSFSSILASIMVSATECRQEKKMDGMLGRVSMF